MLSHFTLGGRRKATTICNGFVFKKESELFPTA